MRLALNLHVTLDPEFIKGQSYVIISTSPDEVGSPSCNGTAALRQPVGISLDLFLALEQNKQGPSRKRILYVSPYPLFRPKTCQNV